MVYLAVCLATLAVTQLRLVPWAREYVHLLVGGLFLMVAVRLAQREDDGLVRHGIALGGLLAPEDDGRSPGPLGLWELLRTLRRGLPSALRETSVALGTAAVIFPPFAFGFAWWHGATHPFLFRWAPDQASFAAAQLLVVALPEEALFRGYFQTRLEDAFPPRRRILGAWLSPRALLLQALLFALVHFLVEPNPQRLAVFFPGLVFGWLRAWRGGIGAAVVFHALSNVYSDLLVRGWL